jgi:hypothetical protein
MSERLPKVYLSQPQWRTNRTLNVRHPLINPLAFREYGSPVYLLDDGAFLDGESIWHEINRRLVETEYDPATDYLVVSGDVTIACLAFHAMQRRGGGRLLRWDRESETYDVIEVPLDSEELGEPIA